MSVGLLLGERYELRAPLGEGGFGSVWRAHDRRMQRDVAVKLLHVIGADRPRFEREALSLAKLNHPNIVTAFDYGADGSVAYLVLELIDGRSLADELASRPGGLAVDRALDVAGQILDGLAAAHAAGFVHRDLKPQNVVGMATGRHIKIVDFGIAYAADRTRMTTTGSLLGTLPYLAPEQLTEAAVDGRADLYALGCLLHELLAGRSPYNADTPARWMYVHQYEGPTPLRVHRPDVPPALDAFVARLLAKDPADRPDDAAAARALLDALPSWTAPAGPDVPVAGPPRAATTAIRPRAAVPASGLRAVHVLDEHDGEVWAVAWSPRGGRLLTAGEDPTLLEWDPVSGRVTRRLGGFDTPVYSIAWAADASYFATAGHAQPTRVWHAARITLARRLHRGDSGRAVSWSSNGVHVAVGGPNGLVRVTDVSVSGRAVPFAGMRGDVYAIGWSPDGRWLAAVGDDGETVLWDTEAEPSHRRLDGSAGTVQALAWSPDSRRLATADGQGAVRVADAATGRTVSVMDSDRAAFALGWSPHGDVLATGGEDRVMRLHDAATGRTIATAAAGAEVYAISWHPQGSALAAATGSRVRIWSVDRA